MTPPLARATPAGEALDSALVALRASGVETPRLDAEVLLAHALGVDRARLVMEPSLPVAGAAARWFRDAVRARATERVPVAYLVGRKGFRRLELEVDPRVLVPRPDTETLVEWAVQALPRGARVADVGTGSGAIALALADERPDLTVLATDLSEDALAVARANATRLGLEVRFVAADLLGDVTEPLDAVVSNPPYVARNIGSYPLLHGEGHDPELLHEPPEALFAGHDGLDVLRRLVAEVRAPVLAVEVGAGQAPAVRELAAAAGWVRTEVRHDLAGRERVVVAWR